MGVWGTCHRQVVPLSSSPETIACALHALAFASRPPPLAPTDRSGQSVKTDAAKYETQHDDKGMGAFLDVELEALSSIVSFTVDYLAGTPPHVKQLYKLTRSYPWSGVLGVPGVLGAPAPLSLSRLDVGVGAPPSRFSHAFGVRCL